MLNELSQQIFKANQAKGFWDTKRNVGEVLMLCVSELAEALEADRKEHYAELSEMETFLDTQIFDEKSFNLEFEYRIKNTFEDELADTIIRILDYCGGRNIDIDKYIELKLRYNELRPHKHGKKY